VPHDPTALHTRARRLEDLFRGAPLGARLGMRLHFDADLQAVVDLAHGPHLDHALGGVHGGVFATLIDTSAWFAAAVHYENWISTIEFHTRLLEPVETEDLIAIGTVVRAGRRIATARSEVRTAAGLLVATGTGSFTTTGVPIG
jgi:uncharacterized protein (TIGR00369 family)